MFLASISEIPNSNAPFLKSGKYLSINSDHLISVFPLEDKTVLFATSGNSWTVAEDFATVLKRLNANI